MEQILRRVRERRDMTGAQMAAGAIRTRFQSEPEAILAELASWTEHGDEYVRIAAGLALGTVTVRNPEILPTVMPWVERLANDQNPEVRAQGAVGALEIIWMYHYDEIWLVMEDWFERKNDLVKKVAIETMGRIVAGGRIAKPSTLKQFIEKGMIIIDRLVTGGSPDLRSSLASVVNEFGGKARDLIAPWVREWTARSDLGSLSLAKDVLELPFGERCPGIDRAHVLKRITEMQSETTRRISGWLRQGGGRVEYFTLLVDRMLAKARGDSRWKWYADPYRGCQFRCEFCSSRDVSEYAGDSEEAFARRIVIVANGAEVLAREIGAPEFRQGGPRAVRIGMHSDPYQPAEDRFQITRELLKTFLERESPVVVQTRSETVLRDLDVFERLAEKGLVNVIVTLPSPIEGIRKKVELGVSSVTERLRTISMLAKKGVPTGIAISPLIPFLTDHPEPVEELIRRAAEAGAAFVIPEILHLTGSAGPKFRQFLEEFIPALVPRYEEVYTAEGALTDAAAHVRRLAEETIPEFAEKHGANRTGLMLA